MKILIIGANGFIGSNLTDRILRDTDWDIYAMDINCNNIEEYLSDKRFHYTEGDIRISNEWTEYHIKKCDVILPLVAIAHPKFYVTDPLRVFELDFEQNLKIIRWAHKYGRRVIFPSTSEVYGMSQDTEFNEETTNFIYGPTHKIRWIYACSKQLLERVIFALGRDHGLNYTMIRPFNWIGPRLDSMEAARYGNSRVLTQFITNLLEGAPIKLVEGGLQKRCFTDINDALDCLMAILKNEDKARGRVFNIGNPDNEISIKDLADLTRRAYCDLAGVPESDLPPVEVVAEEDFYREGYQDITFRVPSIKLARDLLGWAPKVPLQKSVCDSLDYFIGQGKRTLLSDD